MNPELRFIYALLKAPDHEQRAFFDRGLPFGIFKVHAREINWINEYRLRHHRLPSVKLLESSLNVKLPRHKDPVDPSLQVVLDQSMYEDMRALTERTKKVIDTQGVREALTLFRAEAARLSSYETSSSNVQFSRTSLAVDRYRELVNLLNSTDGDSLIDSPWQTYNKLVTFLRPGNLVTISARMGVGKTWLALSWAHYLAAKQVSTLVHSKEMPVDELVDRVEALNYKLPYDQFRAGCLTPRLLRKWKNARKNSAPIPLLLTGDETVTGNGIPHLVDLIQAANPRPRVVFIDGAYLLRASSMGKSASHSDMMREISNTCKRVAKSLRIVLIVTVQLNRDATGKNAKFTGGGSIDTIYGSDAWAQDSDSVVLLKGDRGSPIRLFDVQKGRESAVGAFNIDFQLSPFPYFGETTTLQTVSENVTHKTYKGIS